MKSRFGRSSFPVKDVIISDATMYFIHNDIENYVLLPLVIRGMNV